MMLKLAQAVAVVALIVVCISNYVIWRDCAAARGLTVRGPFSLVCLRRS